MPTTNENLQTAFAGESQANRKYLAFAKQAEKEGFNTVAKLFKTIAEAETIHAHGHLKALGGIKSTAENLEAAIGGETYEFSDMYPPMLETAEGEGHKAKIMFKYAVEAEQVHADLYKKALGAVKTGKDLDSVEIYLCPVCGHVEIGKPTENCPICNVAPDKYVMVS